MYFLITAIKDLCESCRTKLEKIHARLGDFWWYSLMIFMAARAADCLNVFVGLWLVPKYVPPSELGAVQPLANFASFLALPIAVFASTFRQELSNLAQTNQFGKMKTLMKTVFIAAAIFFFVAIVVSHFVLPHFLKRIRIAEGTLGMLIIVYSFINALAPIFQNALQSLKKFKATTVINFLGAPVRFLAMLATMPLRALSGYFVGQASTPAFSIITSVIALRKELSVKAEPYWTRDAIRRGAQLMTIFGIHSVSSAILAFAEALIIRQRLPEIDSAAYYIMSRFGEIATFLTSALLFTIFPFTAELAAKGKSTLPVVFKASLAIIVTNGLFAALFWFCSPLIIPYIPHGDKFVDYTWATQWLILIATTTSIIAIYITAEVSSNRFAFLYRLVPCNIIYTVLLFAITGHGYATGIIPESWSRFLSQHNISSLQTMMYWMAGGNLIRLFCCITPDIFSRTKQSPSMRETHLSSIDG